MAEINGLLNHRLFIVVCSPFLSIPFFKLEFKKLKINKRNKRNTENILCKMKKINLKSLFVEVDLWKRHRASIKMEAKDFYPLFMNELCDGDTSTMVNAERNIVILPPQKNYIIFLYIIYNSNTPKKKNHIL